MKIVRKYNHTKTQFFDMLYNKYGAEKLQLSYNYIDNEGVKRFTRWVPYGLLTLMEQKDVIPGYPIRMTKESFIAQVTHRTVLDIELLVDLDELHPVFSNMTDQARWIVEYMNKQGFEVSVYHTGSKSYHISILMPSLRDMPERKRTDIKRAWLKLLGGDLMKSSPKCMIACEGAIHYKSGKPKSKVIL